MCKPIVWRRNKRMQWLKVQEFDTVEEAQAFMDARPTVHLIWSYEQPKQLGWPA
jgi:hypothetical protein